MSTRRRDQPIEGERDVIPDAHGSSPTMAGVWEFAVLLLLIGAIALVVVPRSCVGAAPAART